ncbi:MAG: NAD(P)H-hydrate dehydratase [Deltaproteobacteria bacterium]|nr:NAD(P)H-hydrate dehydratase [Deltaproteobacteria bacterium]
MKLLTVEEARALDGEAIKHYGVPGVVLMENAGRGAACFFHEFFHKHFPGPVLVVCGKGNNGGDGYVIARHLELWGWQVQVLVLAEHEAIGGDARINLEILLKTDMTVHFAANEERFQATKASLGRFAVVIDAIFGNGLAKDVEGLFAQAITWINASGAAVGAVDIASGTDANCGRVLGCGIQAACSATFIAPKVGQMTGLGKVLGGEIRSVDIGLPRELLESVSGTFRAITTEEAASLLPKRPLAGHKGSFGHMLVVAGSTGKSGAAMLSALGGARSGAGLVTVACPASLNAILESRLIEPMTCPLPDAGNGFLGVEACDEILTLLHGKQVLALGPGLGTAQTTERLVCRLLEVCALPVVLDADALNIVCGNLSVLRNRQSRHVVMTPHPGEMARLVGKPIAEIEADRIGVARNFACEFDVVLVLKGAGTVIASPSGQVTINTTGNPGMACGGMGDLLTGLIAGLIAQGVEPAEAAALGVWLHGAAADRLAAVKGVAGLTACEVAELLPETMKELQEAVL